MRKSCRGLLCMRWARRGVLLRSSRLGQNSSLGCRCGRASSRLRSVLLLVGLLQGLQSILFDLAFRSPSASNLGRVGDFPLNDELRLCPLLRRCRQAHPRSFRCRSAQDVAATFSSYPRDELMNRPGLVSFSFLFYFFFVSLQTITPRRRCFAGSVATSYLLGRRLEATALRHRSVDEGK